MCWVKFAILLDEPWRVFYQDSTEFPFHYDFAAQRLAPFLGLDRPGFDAVSLRRENQRVVLGTLLYPLRWRVSDVTTARGTEAWSLRAGFP